MPIRVEHLTDEATPSGHPAVTGRVIIENKWPMSIWYLKALARPTDTETTPDRLEGPIIPGGTHIMDLPAGVYRLVAETGGGTVFRSPLMQVVPGCASTWEISHESQ